MTTLISHLTQTLPQSLTRLIGIDEPTGNRTQIGSAAYPGDDTPRCREEGDTFLLIDVSGSMSHGYQGAQSKLDAAKCAAQSHCVERRRNDPDARVGLIAFSHDARVICPPVILGREQPKLLGALHGLSAGGGTDMGAAMRCARDRLGGMPGRVVLISDGHGGDPTPAAETVKSNGGIVSCIGIGSGPSQVDEARLKRAASDLDGKLQYWFVHDLKLLTQTMTMLAANLRQN